MKTYTAKKEDIERQWFVIDAKDQTLGRMASQIASILRGKHKPIFTPHMDTGDFVIVVNAEKIHVTGDRLDQKLYYRHSGYPGGLRSKSLRQMLRDKPEDVIYEAVRRMLPKNNLGRQMLKKLKVYAGPEHPHAAQQPVKLELEN
ncbi:MAG TPA: 50S ribosomal protein L13 [Aggregatilineales bacterium]|nr:50S ribosomal protein L13 [Aggregatilineales bacterium]HPV06307.1 50S ribosomal protein L13 [Aggregatilineales bacterium]HQA67183.1 50S ribosomal protein L13 [Aggregatilineales bacterium]HQE17831.1 50S ribosomal protein L13 [Aggregatilineales bacterium]